MTKKILAVVALAMAVAAVPAQASGGSRTTLTVSLVPNFALPVSCPDTQFGFGLDVSSLAGRRLGTGQTCIASPDGCDPFVAYCRQTVRSTLTLDLARGSLTVPLRLLEIRPTENSFIQLGAGRVSSGTGAYASATGRVAGGGAGSFDEQGAFAGRLVYVCELHDTGSSRAR
jgi:hypothetical protein